MKKREIRKVHINNVEWQYIIQGRLYFDRYDTEHDSKSTYIGIILGAPNSKFPGKFNWKKEEINVDEHKYFHYECGGDYSCDASDYGYKCCPCSRVSITPSNVKKYIETIRLTSGSPI